MVKNANEICLQTGSGNSGLWVAYKLYVAKRATPASRARSGRIAEHFKGKTKNAFRAQVGQLRGGAQLVEKKSLLLVSTQKY